MHITSYVANDRKEAIELFKKDNKSAKIGFNFWNYYITGITHTNPTHIKLAYHGK